MKSCILNRLLSAPILTLLILTPLISACTTAATPITPPAASLIASPPPPTDTLSPSATSRPASTPAPTRQPVQSTQTPTPAKSSFSIKLTDSSITLTFPDTYSIVKSEEINRRGSFVSYDFIPAGGYQTPYLQEIQFFTAESIEQFTQNCSGASPCFFGDYPDLDRYYGQLKAYKELADFEDFELRRFADRYYFVSNHPCEGDACVIREYTTFLSGDIKVDVWVLMEDESQTQQSDMLFLSFHIQE